MAALLTHINFDYVSKMVYNKDKDLVFVYRANGFWGEHEHVYEMHHLEQMVPSASTAVADLSMNRDDGILTVHDMSTKDYLKFYNEDKYWNMDLKDDFVGQTRSLWVGENSKYNGRLFHVNHRADEEITLTQLKVDRELQEAVAKHGEVHIPERYENQWKRRVEENKHRLAGL